MEEIYVVIPSNNLQATINKLKLLNLKFRLGSEDWLDDEISKLNHSRSKIYSNLYSNIGNPQSPHIDISEKSTNIINSSSSEFSEYEDNEIENSSSLEVPSEIDKNINMGSSSSKSKSSSRVVPVEPVKIEKNVISLDPEYRSIEIKTPSPVDPRNTTSRNLGVSGEEEIFNLLVSQFPKLEVKLISNTPHVGDIHVIDSKANTLFMFEIKNKRYLNSEDISKFKRDIQTVKNLNQSSRVIGIFISLISPIPTYGSLHIESSMAFLGGQELITPSSISVLIEMYSRLNKQLMKIENKQETVKYEFPENAYTLIAQLAVQFSGANKEIQDFEAELATLDKLRANISTHIHAAKTRLEFIKMLKHEFSIITDDDDEDRIIENEELRFRDWIRENRKASKTKMIEEFPQLEHKLRTMTLEVIRRNYLD